MAFLVKEKILSKQFFKNYSLVIVGCFVMAASFVFFIDPHGIVPGGVFGIGIVINKMTQGMFPNGIFGFMAETFHKYQDGIPIGLTSWLLNIPLVIIGIKVLGPRFGFKTIFGFSITAIFLDSLTNWWGLTPLVDDILLSCIFGGVLIGFGLALIFKAKATTAGSDIIAMIISKYTKLPLGQLLIYVDSVIVLTSLLVVPNWQIPLYSWIVIFVTGKVIDATMNGGNYEKSLFIISDKHEIIREKILVDMKRGGTYFTGQGLYDGLEKKVIFTNVNRRELSILQGHVKEVDPNAFITVFDAKQVVGSGFKSLNEVDTD